MLSQVLVTDYRPRRSHILKRKWMFADFPLSCVRPRAGSPCCNLSHNLRGTTSDPLSADKVGLSEPGSPYMTLQTFSICLRILPEIYLCNSKREDWRHLFHISVPTDLACSEAP